MIHRYSSYAKDINAKQILWSKLKDERALKLAEMNRKTEMRISDLQQRDEACRCKLDIRGHIILSQAGGQSPLFVVSWIELGAMTSGILLAQVDKLWLFLIFRLHFVIVLQFGHLYCQSLYK